MYKIYNHIDSFNLSQRINAVKFNNDASLIVTGKRGMRGELGGGMRVER